ncbi:SRR1 domain-containing protein [Purpureocillium lilacinum]|uniref:SRR1 domain-containing protein n=1 Tax=Purpureocillium lilacinum TaxID=33203 RepID=A0A179GHS6_PURLI|nr:SRR1 domain-containing protein [Purpureocillium lilacinum]OAQ76893.1 SRR1 domain-containing protein [Purpureocillium lilacinum]
MPPPNAAGDDEWTTIKPKNNRRRRNNNSSSNLGHDARNASRSALAAAKEALPPGTARPDGPVRSVSSIEAEYRTLRETFEASSCCASLRALAGRIAAAAAGHKRRRKSSSSSSRGDDNEEDEAEPAPPVTKAVCLGIGTFDPPDGGWEPKRRTFLQLIAFLILVEELERLTRTTIPCLFQEPIFSASDAAFLTASLGHSVVEHPRGCHAVDRRALLYGVHLYRPIYALALAGGGGAGGGRETRAYEDLPAVFVGTGWDVWDAVALGQPGGGGGGDGEDGQDGDNDDGFMRRLRVMEDTYERADFPQDDPAHGTAFSSTSVYWRRGAVRGGDPERTGLDDGGGDGSRRGEKGGDGGGAGTGHGGEGASDGPGGLAAQLGAVTIS